MYNSGLPLSRPFVAKFSEKSKKPMGLLCFWSPDGASLNSVMKGKEGHIFPIHLAAGV